MAANDLLIGDIVSVAICNDRVMAFMRVKKITKSYIICEMPVEYRVNIAESDYRVEITEEQRRLLVENGQTNIRPLNKWYAGWHTVFIRLARSIDKVKNNDLKDYSRFTNPETLFNIKMTFHDKAGCELDNLSNERFVKSKIVNNDNLLAIIQPDA